MPSSGLSQAVLIVLIAYPVYSVWNAYFTGCTHGMLRKNKVKGVVRYGPYLSLTVSFATVRFMYRKGLSKIGSG